MPSVFSWQAFYDIVDRSAISKRDASASFASMDDPVTDEQSEEQQRFRARGHDGSYARADHRNDAPAAS